jgi:hypothetical protein
MGPLQPSPTHLTDGWCSGNNMDYFGRCSLRISAILTEVFSGFPQSPQDDTMIVPQLGHDHFLRNPFQPSLIHPTFRVLVQYVLRRLKNSAILNVIHLRLGPPIIYFFQVFGLTLCTKSSSLRFVLCVSISHTF